MSELQSYLAYSDTFKFFFKEIRKVNLKEEEILRTGNTFDNLCYILFLAILEQHSIKFKLRVLIK